MKIKISTLFLCFALNLLANTDSQFDVLKNDVCEYLKESWCSEEKANLIMDVIFETKPKVCVEIGVFTGSSFLPIAATLAYLRQGHAYAIDSWSNQEAIKFIPYADPNYKWWATVDMQEIKNQFLSMLDVWSFNSYVSVIHASSEKAISQIDSIDFLHLDGDFSEEGSLHDLDLYLPKVKSGGYILLSNLFYVIDNQLTKMKTLWTLFDACEIVAEIDQSNTILFQKN